MVQPSSLINEHRDHPALGIWTFIGNLLLMALLSAAVRELVNGQSGLSVKRGIIISLFVRQCFFLGYSLINGRTGGACNAKAAGPCHSQH
jgi:hypothetical protein